MIRRRPYGGTRRRVQRGLSLVELMIGLTVGMLIVAGLATMFANASRSSAELDKSMRHIENGRHAIDLLAEDLSMAGYYGTAAVSNFAEGALPCADAAAQASALNVGHAGATPPTLPLPVRGYTDSEVSPLGCSFESRKAGTPILVLRRLDTTALAAATAPAGTLVLQSSHHPDDVPPFIASTSGTGLILRDRLGNPNVVRSFVQRIYYVSSCSDCSGSGDGITTLKRLELRGNGFVSVPLAEGIDQVAFDYGFDTSGDGVPDTWIGLGGNAGTAESTAAATAQWRNVVAVRITVLSRNIDPTPGYVDSKTYTLGLQGTTAYTTPAAYGDAFKRRVATTTARLNSVAGLRETP